MQGHHEFQPELFSAIDFESLIPRHHLLRRIDRVLDLRFLPEMTLRLYCDGKGRPSIDPVVFVRMSLLSYLYNIGSDRRLCEEVGYNLAYRWFCRLSLQDSIPDHSSFTRIRDRLGEETYQKIFLAVVEQCRKAGLVKGERVMTDGSIIKANASIYNMEEREASGDEANTSLSQPQVSEMHSKDGLSSNDLRRGNIQGKKISNDSHVSRTDPESTLAGKAHETKSLSYKSHHMIDAESRVIIDCHVTTGTVSEVSTVCDRVDTVKEILSFEIKEAIADRGYGSGEALHDLEQRGVETNIPLWSTRSGQSMFRDLENGFAIEEDGKKIICPAGHEMKRRGRDNSTKRSKFFMPAKTCRACLFAAKRPPGNFRIVVV